MKKLLALGVALILSRLAFSQAAVIDVSPDKKIWQSDMLMKSIEQIQTNHEIIAETRDTKEALKATKSQIEELYKLYRKGEDAVNTAKRIKDLKTSDLAYFADKLTGYSEELDEYIPNVPYARDVKDIYTNRGTRSARRVYYTFLRDFSIPLNEKEAKKSSTSVLNKAIFDQAEAQKKIELAYKYRDIAERFEEQSLELSSKANSDNELRMTDFERIQTNLEAQSLLIKSIEYRKLSDQLLREALEKSEAIQQVEVAEHNIMIREKLRNKKVTKYGNVFN